MNNTRSKFHSLYNVLTISLIGLIMSGCLKQAPNLLSSEDGASLPSPPPPPPFTTLETDLLEPRDNVYTNSKLDIAGRCSSLFAVHYEMDGQTNEIVCLGGIFNLRLILQGDDGVKTLKVWQKNEAGKVLSFTRKINYLKNAPEISIDKPRSIGETENRLIRVTGTCQLGLNVQFSGDIVLLNPLPCLDGFYSKEIELSEGDGSKTIFVEVADLAGNKSSASHTLALKQNQLVADDKNSGIQITKFEVANRNMLPEIPFSRSKSYSVEYSESESESELAIQFSNQNFSDDDDGFDTEEQAMACSEGLLPEGFFHFHSSVICTEEKPCVSLNGSLDFSDESLLIAIRFCNNKNLSLFTTRADSSGTITASLKEQNQAEESPLSLSSLTISNLEFWEVGLSQEVLNPRKLILSLTGQNLDVTYSGIGNQNPIGGGDNDGDGIADEGEGADEGANEANQSPDGSEEEPPIAVMMRQVSGFVYHNDVDDGKEFATVTSYNSNFRGLEGWTVFADLNSNGTLDDGEPFAISDAAGRYALSFMLPGKYYIKAIVPELWVKRTPINGSYHTITFGLNDASITRHFGNSLINVAD